MRRYFIWVLLVVLIYSGCSKKEQNQSQSTPSASTPVAATQARVGPQQPQSSVPPKEIKAEGNTFQPFFIYSEKNARTNHYVPSGFMPDGKCIKFNDAWMDNCHADKTCIKIEYDVQCSKENLQWAGVYWLNPANNWGARKGGFDLTGATKLTFWAKGEKGGERLEEFKIGGLTGEYPDSDSALIGPVILTAEWKKYTIDLRGKDLSYISGGFAWSTNVDVNPTSCTFYLDDIQFE